eukprot:931570-Pelagomonas_calceolata.AAC.4
MLAHCSRLPCPNRPLAVCQQQQWAAASRPPNLAIHLDKPAACMSQPWLLKQPGTAQLSRRRQRIAQVFQQDADVVPETNDEWDDEDDRA